MYSILTHTRAHSPTHTHTHTHTRTHTRTNTRTNTLKGHHRFALCRKRRELPPTFSIGLKNPPSASISEKVNQGGNPTFPLPESGSDPTRESRLVGARECFSSSPPEEDASSPASSSGWKLMRLKTPMDLPHSIASPVEAPTVTLSPPSPSQPSLQEIRLNESPSAEARKTRKRGHSLEVPPFPTEAKVREKRGAIRRKGIHKVCCKLSGAISCTICRIVKIQ